MNKGEKKTVTLSDDEVVIARTMGRRSGMAMLGAGVIGAVGLVAGMSQRVEAQCSDRDPQDPPGRGRSCCRGISDADPSDPAGCGRRFCSDTDTGDPVGRGRHC
jgi:hypothetical protein